MNIGETYHFPCLARDRKSPPQRRIIANIFSKELICIGEKSVPQTACLLSQVNKYTAELSLGSSRNTFWRRAQMSTEICIKLFTRRRIKRQIDDVPSRLAKIFIRLFWNRVLKRDSCST